MSAVHKISVLQVIMALHEKKLPYKEHIINLTKGEQYQPWFLRINPRGEVPVLKDGVKVIPDSGRILDYLEDNFSNGLYSLCCGKLCGKQLIYL
jgi:glutathione S-transferase